MNFCISANSLTKKYECKTTHSATPFLKVNSSQYLDLTTNSTSGLQVKIKYNNAMYRPLQITSTSKQITVTTGYSGVSSTTSSSSKILNKSQLIQSVIFKTTTGGIYGNTAYASLSWEGSYGAGAPIFTTTVKSNAYSHYIGTSSASVLTLGGTKTFKAYFGGTVYCVYSQTSGTAVMFSLNFSNFASSAVFRYVSRLTYKRAGNWKNNTIIEI